MFGFCYLYTCYTYMKLDVIIRLLTYVIYSNFIWHKIILLRSSRFKKCLYVNYLYLSAFNGTLHCSQDLLNFRLE